MNRAVTIIQLGLLAALLSLSFQLNAKPQGHYRWTDEKGTVQYSDRPPEGVDAEFIKFATGKRSKTRESDGEPEATAQPNPDRKEASMPDMEVMPKKDPSLCKKAKANMKALEAARIRMTDLDGTQRYLTEEEKEEQRDNARKFIKVHC